MERQAARPVSLKVIWGRRQRHSFQPVLGILTVPLFVLILQTVSKQAAIFLGHVVWGSPHPRMHRRMPLTVISGNKPCDDVCRSSQQQSYHRVSDRAAASAERFPKLTEWALYEVSSGIGRHVRPRSRDPGRGRGLLVSCPKACDPPSTVLQSTWNSTCRGHSRLMEQTLREENPQHEAKNRAS